MRRREFIALFVSAAAWPLGSQAQAFPGRPLIGFLAGASSASVLASTGPAFLAGLREQGLVEGRDFEIAYSFAEGHLDRLSLLAQQLVQLKPETIFAVPTPAALAARQATATIPIVCPLLENPVRAGLVVSENRPGGNVTGILRYVDGLAGKDLELAKELFPSAFRVGLLVNTASVENTAQRRDVEAAARQLNIVIVPAEVRQPGDLDAALTSLAGANVQAVIVLQDSMFFSEHQRITALAALERLPTVWTASLFVDDAGLISYGVDEVDSFRHAAIFVQKILKGAKPSDLPLELPTKFELAINMKTAKALGIEVPAKLLARADKVIE
jgi:putative tryptophan/tyrosine transport system substrate-binding protein